MDKKITEDLLAVDLQDYYHALNKRDKGKLLHYLMDKYGMAYTTIINKFAGRLEMSKADIVLFNLAVNDESLWKKYSSTPVLKDRSITRKMGMIRSGSPSSQRLSNR